MGSVELLFSVIGALIYLGIPVVTLIIVLRINNRLKKIEQGINLVLKS